MAAFDGDAVGLLVAAGRPRARLSNDKWIHKAARHPRERASPRERPLFGMHGVDTNGRFQNLTGGLYRSDLQYETYRS